MKQIPVQADNITSLAAADFNEIPREEENAIQSSGQTLTSTDLEQLAKALAIYAAQGDVYTDGGSANNYVLSVTGIQKNPPAYVLGMRVRFKADNTNNATACTVNVAGLGSRSINFGALANGGTPSVPADTIRDSEMYELIYDQTPDGLTSYFRLPGVSLYEITNGILNIISGANRLYISDIAQEFRVDYGAYTKTIQVTANSIKFLRDAATELELYSTLTIIHGADGSKLTTRGGNGATEKALEYESADSGRSAYWDSTGAHVVSNNASESRVTNTGKGISYINGPGSGSVTNARTSVFGASSLAWTVDPGSIRIYLTASNIVLTGIPASATIIGATLSYNRPTGEQQSVPLTTLTEDDGSGTMEFIGGIVTSSYDPSTAGTTNHSIYIIYEATGIL